MALVHITLCVCVSLLAMETLTKDIEIVLVSGCALESLVSEEQLMKGRNKTTTT